MENRFLFRGKRKDGNGLVVGYYIPMQHNDERTHIHHFIMPLGTDMSRGRLLEDCLVEVEGESVGQCTGLTDKNGKLVFEGAVVDTKTRYGKGAVIFESGIYKVNGLSLNTFRPQIEIIGNRFDNPELLEVEA